MLNERMLVFFGEQGVPMLRILTDRGSEYHSNREPTNTRCTGLDPLSRTSCRLILSRLLTDMSPFEVDR